MNMLNPPLEELGCLIICSQEICESSLALWMLVIMMRVTRLDLPVMHLPIGHLLPAKIGAFLWICKVESLYLNDFHDS
jgi:hypothetical protein